MRTESRQRRRTTGLLAAALACGVVLTGCTSDDTPSAAPAIVAAASDSPVQTTDLSAGLLPAAAFGDGATVRTVSLDDVRGQLQQALGTVSPGDLTLTPDTCATALAALPRPGAAAGDRAALDGAAAQVARLGTTLTLEGIASGSAVTGAVALVSGLLTDCSSVTVTVAGQGTASVDTTAVGVPAIGDGAAAATVTVTVTGTSGPARTVTALVGAVQDGDRVVALASGSLFGGVDEPSFLALLQQAYDTQATALD